MDYVFPNGNEDLFISMAKRLGTKSICLVYKEASIRISCEGLDIVIGSMKRTQHTDLVVVKADNLREQLPDKKIDVIYGIEGGYGKDHTHYRKSGMDQVLCKLAESKKIGISF